MKTPWASIAKIEADGVHSGTGFLVTAKHVLTARHVVADKTGRPFPRIWLRFFVAAETGGADPVFETQARIVEGYSSEQDDFALLVCDQLPPSSTPLRLSDACLPFRDCVSPGFAIQDSVGFTVTGKISSLNDPVYGGGTAIGIQFEFGSGVLMKGHSGAPVLIDDRVIGLLRTAFLDENEKTMGGIVHATSIVRAVEFCNQLSPGLLAYRAPVAWPHPSSRPNRTTTPDRILADRKGEFEVFERMITGQTNERVLLLKGESGSGKSTLADELISYAREIGIKVAQADCKGCPTMESVFQTLIFEFGPGFLRKAEPAAGASRFFAMIEDLTSIERPLLIAIDTWQESSDEVRKWMDQLFLPSLLRMPAVLVMIGGHEVPEPGGRAWGELVAFRELDVIGTEDWFEYCRLKWPSSNISKDHVEGVIFTLGAYGRPNVIAPNLKAVHLQLVVRNTSGEGR